MFVKKGFGLKCSIETKKTHIVRQFVLYFIRPIPSAYEFLWICLILFEKSIARDHQCWILLSWIFHAPQLYLCACVISKKSWTNLRVSSRCSNSYNLTCSTRTWLKSMRSDIWMVGTIYSVGINGIRPHYKKMGVKLTKDWH
jgi:hypothetical protein